MIPYNIVAETYRTLRLIETTSPECYMIIILENNNMTKRYGKSLTESMIADYEKLEAHAHAMIEKLKAETPDPLQEINDELAACSTPTERQRVKERTFGARYGLARFSKEPTVRTNNQSTLP